MEISMCYLIDWNVFPLQESEIAEVLYKQDVDLGFSLDQEAIINASYASGNSAATNVVKSKPEDEFFYLSFYLYM